MRALALGILLVINLVLLFWQVMVHKPEVPVSLAEPDVGELLLLSELELAETADFPDPVPVETAVPPGQMQAEEITLSDEEAGGASVEVTPAEPESDSVAVAGTLVASETASGDDPEGLAELSLDDVRQADEDAQASTTVAQVIAQDPQELIGEAEPLAEAGESIGQPQPTEPEVGLIGPARQCWQLGPFDNAAEAVRLAQALPPGVNRLSVEEATVSVPRGYYVLIPPFATRAEALRIERELKAEGVEDSWVFITGPLKNAVSLGLFNRELNAKRRLQLVQSKGFEPELRVRYRDTEKIVLLVEGASDETVREALEALSGEGLEAVSCPE